MIKYGIPRNQLLVIWTYLKEKFKGWVKNYLIIEGLNSRPKFLFKEQNLKWNLRAEVGIIW